MKILQHKRMGEDEGKMEGELGGKWKFRDNFPILPILIVSFFRQLTTLPSASFIKNLVCGVSERENGGNRHSPGVSRNDLGPFGVAS